MIFTTNQKIIKIGSSRGITLPAKQLQEMQVQEGDEVKVTIESVRKKTISDEYANFKSQYGETLKNLADR